MSINASKYDELLLSANSIGLKTEPGSKKESLLKRGLVSSIALAAIAAVSYMYLRPECNFDIGNNMPYISEYDNLNGMSRIIDSIEEGCPWYASFDKITEIKKAFHECYSNDRNFYNLTIVWECVKKIEGVNLSINSRWRS